MGSCRDVTSDSLLKLSNNFRCSLVTRVCQCHACDMRSQESLSVWRRKSPLVTRVRENVRETRVSIEPFLSVRISLWLFLCDKRAFSHARAKALLSNASERKSHMSHELIHAERKGSLVTRVTENVTLKSSLVNACHPCDIHELVYTCHELTYEYHTR